MIGMDPDRITLLGKMQGVVKVIVLAGTGSTSVNDESYTVAIPYTTSPGMFQAACVVNAYNQTSTVSASIAVLNGSTTVASASGSTTSYLNVICVNGFTAGNTIVASINNAGIPVTGSVVVFWVGVFDTDYSV